MTSDSSKPYTQNEWTQGTDPKNQSAVGSSGQQYYTPTPPTQDVPVTKSQSYYDYPPWQNNWPHSGGYVYSNVYQMPQSQPQPQTTFVPYHSQSQQLFNSAPSNSSKVPHIPSVKQKSSAPTPSPSPPPPETYRNWDKVIISFLEQLGLTQAAAGFEADMLVLNPDWEQKKVPDALSELSKNISVCVCSWVSIARTSP